MKDHRTDNKQLSLPEKWPLHSTKESEMDALQNQVFSDLLGRHRVASSMKGFPASSIVNFEWHATQGQSLSFPQKN